MKIYYVVWFVSNLGCKIKMNAEEERRATLLFDIEE
jgi:hypothetical protein